MNCQIASAGGSGGHNCVYIVLPNMRKFLGHLHTTSILGQCAFLLLRLILLTLTGMAIFFQIKGDAIVPEPDWRSAAAAFTPTGYANTAAIKYGSAGAANTAAHDDVAAHNAHSAESGIACSTAADGGVAECVVTTCTKQTMPNQQQQQPIQLQPSVQPAVQQQTLPMIEQVPATQFESILVQTRPPPPPVLQPQQGQQAQQGDDMLIGENEEAALGILSTSGRSGGGGSDGGGFVSGFDPSMTQRTSQQILTRRPTPCPTILRGSGARTGGRVGGGGGQGRQNVVGNRHLARSPPPPPPPRGLTHREITEMFPVVEVDLQIAEEICSICQDHLVASSIEATVTPCSHYFHFDCAKRWFRRVGKCPNCQADILLFYATELSRRQSANNAHRG